jgi:hypothetical protein
VHDSDLGSPAARLANDAIIARCPNSAGSIQLALAVSEMIVATFSQSARREAFAA